MESPHPLLLEAQAELSRNEFQGIYVAAWNGGLVLRDLNGHRAEGSCDIIVRIIRSAADADSIWQLCAELLSENTESND